MMKYFLSICLFLIISLSACDKVEGPDCLEKSIRQFERRAFCETGSHVEEYLLDGELVYVFYEGACGADFSYDVLNIHCELIGSLGGIQGNNEIQGKSFLNAKHQRTIWSN